MVRLTLLELMGGTVISVERVIDLTRPIREDIAMWPGTPAPSFETGVTVAHDGFFARRALLWEHTGTQSRRLPAHFDRRRRDDGGHT